MCFIFFFIGFPENQAGMPPCTIHTVHSVSPTESLEIMLLTRVSVLSIAIILTALAFCSAVFHANRHFLYTKPLVASASEIGRY